MPCPKKTINLRRFGSSFPAAGGIPPCLMPAGVVAFDAPAALVMWFPIFSGLLPCCVPSPQKKPVGLLAFDAMSHKKAINLWHCWCGSAFPAARDVPPCVVDVALLFQQHVTFLLALMPCPPPQKKSTCWVGWPLTHLRHWWFDSQILAAFFDAASSQKLINLQGYWPLTSRPTQKTINLRHCWLALLFQQRLMPHPKRNQSTSSFSDLALRFPCFSSGQWPAALVTLPSSMPRRHQRLQNNQPVAFVIWLGISSGIGNAAFFDIAYWKKESTCAIRGLHCRQFKKLKIIISLQHWWWCFCDTGAFLAPCSW